MNTTTFSIYGKNLTFDSNFLKFYEEKTTTTLEEMAPGFLAGEYNEECNYDVEARMKLIESKTEKELEQILLKWANFDLKCINAPYPIE